jgi:hypothetical protein
MAKIDPVAQAADGLAGELIRFSLAGVANRDALAALRAQVQKLDSSGDGAITDNDEYIDLDHWAELLQGSPTLSAAVKASATTLRAAIGDLILTPRSQSGTANSPITGAPQPVALTNARGLAIYYPPRPGVRSYQTYRNELSFATDSRWDEWLQAQLSALGVIQPAADPNPVAPLAFPRAHTVYLPMIRR